MKNKDTDLGKATILIWQSLIMWGFLIIIGYGESGIPVFDSFAVWIASLSLAKSITATILGNVISAIIEPNEIKPGELAYGCPSCGQNPRRTPYPEHTTCSDCVGMLFHEDIS